MPNGASLIKKAAIEVRDLCRSFGGIPALKGLSLAVKEGEIFTVLGANGSGKSTLIRILSTVLLPDSGRVMVLGHDVVRQAGEVRRIVTRVSVDPTLDRQLSPRENLAWLAPLYRQKPAAVIERCWPMLRRFGLKESDFHRPVRYLSAGSRQKVAIVRALISSPAVLVLDEPTTGLDPVSRQEVHLFVRAINRTAGVTILLATNDLAQAEELSDRIAIIKDGKIVLSGTVAELLELGPGARNMKEVFFRVAGYVPSKGDMVRPEGFLSGVA